MSIPHIGSHRRAVRILVGVLLLALLALALFIVYLSRSGQQEAAAQPPSLQSQLKPFVGQWYAHWGALTVNPDGHAKLIARTYQWCGPDVSPPCDSLQGNTIVPGINEEMEFTSVAGSTAHGKIVSSTAKKTGQPVTLSINSNDTVELSGQGELCGPKSPSGTCGA
jgi:hypothetical protein